MLSFLKKFTFLQKILGLDSSGKVAKDRLRLVLIHDRSSISPQLMENLKYDLIKIISKYMVIDEESIEMGLDNKNGTVALAANIPILKIKSSEAQQLELIEEQTEKTLAARDPRAENKENESNETKEEKVNKKPDYAPAPDVARTRRKSYTNYRARRNKRKSCSARAKRPGKIPVST